MNIFLDIILTLLHVVLILFNALGWIWKRTRKAHLLTICITAASWFILGIWYGLGYCFLTDWHWGIKQQLGETNLPASFIKYAVDKISGGDINANLVDVITLIVFLGAIGMSLYFTFFRLKRAA